MEPSARFSGKRVRCADSAANWPAGIRLSGIYQVGGRGSLCAVPGAGKTNSGNLSPGDSQLQTAEERGQARKKKKKKGKRPSVHTSVLSCFTLVAASRRSCKLRETGVVSDVERM